MLISKNPATEEILAEFPELTSAELDQKLATAHSAFELWKETSFFQRKEKMLKLAEILKANAFDIGRLATLEMGKPITQAKAEVEKCAWVCEYYASEAEKILAREVIETDASESFVQFDPLGIILAVMPWNFPFWQVIRFISPAAMAGNVGVLKHASNVPQCGMKIEEVFHEAEFPEGIFQYLAIGSGAVESVIRDPRVKAATVTGSEYAGSQVAKIAGEEMKKTVLELGGSDAFIVLADADSDEAAKVGAVARLINTGQSCICAKRFILVESIAEKFLEKLKCHFETAVIGNPMDEKTTVGPLVNAASRETIEKQVAESVARGAKILTGGKRVGERGYFYAPTILINVIKGMPAYDEEIFGPVASVIVVHDEDEAVQVANDSRFGLGASVWTGPVETHNNGDACNASLQKIISQIEAGCVFINGLVKSDPRLPFGGIKKSGYGRELGSYGIKEFVNIKTVWIR